MTTIVPIHGGIIMTVNKKFSYKKTQTLRDNYRCIYDKDIDCEINYSSEDNEWRWSICHQLLYKENNGVGIIISIGGECSSRKECEKKIEENVKKVEAWKITGK
jgi:hypothetical protein